MKNIYLLLAILGVFVASCDMDKYPYSAVKDTEYFKNYNEFTSARIGIYSLFRSLTTGEYRLATEFQGNAFNAKLGFSNNYGDFYTWDIQTSNGTASDVWAGYYSEINRCNYYLDKGIAKWDTITVQYSNDEKASIKNYAGEAYFARAYCFYQLAQFFCGAYDASSASNAATGVPLQITYSPTTSGADYKGRSTLADTYAQIKSDLDKAAALITTAGSVGNNYISVDAITAMRARVALSMKDYANAATYAVSLIGGTYTLTAGSTLAAMWQNDAGTEAIWQIAMPSANELGSGDGSWFYGNNKFSELDYIPSKDLISLYSAKDYRLTAYFATGTLDVSSGASAKIYAFNKYCKTGKVYTAVKTEASKYVHEAQVFRVAEMYLIAAEAYAKQSTPDLVNASKYLNALEAARINGYTDQIFVTADALMLELKLERRRELAGEGFFLFDQKRWGEGVTRTASQNNDLVYLPTSTKTVLLSKLASDYQMIWPIPKSEMDVNPQLAGEQNPGY